MTAPASNAKEALSLWDYTPTVSGFFQAHIHRVFSSAADELATVGFLSTPERIALSKAIGDGLEAFAAAVDPSVGDRSMPMGFAQDRLYTNKEHEPERETLASKVKRWLKPEPDREMVAGSSAAGSAFVTFKDADGNYRWLGIYSNTLVDREAEAFSEDAHRDFEAYVDETKDYPELRVWHEAGAVIGMADVVAFDSSGYMLASGTFNELGEALAPALKAYDGVWGMSHGYRYSKGDLRDGVYHRYRSFEVSVLPLDAAANLKTGFDLEGMENMALRKDKRELFARLGGEEFAKGLEARMESFAKDASPDELVALKDLLDSVAEPATAETPPNPAEKATEPPAEQPQDGGVADALKAIAENMKGIGEGLAAVNAKLDKHDAAIAELRKSDDEKISKAWGAAFDPSKFKPASESQESVVNGNNGTVKAIKEEAEGGKAAFGGLDPWYLRSAMPNQAAGVATE